MIQNQRNCNDITLSKPSISVLKLALMIGGILFFGYLSLILFIRSDHLRMVLTDIGTPLNDFFVIAALYYGARRSFSLSKRIGLAWTILTIAVLSFTIGDTVWGILEAGLNQSPWPSLSDYFYVLFYPLFLAGVLILPSARLTTREWIKRSLDMGIVILAAALGFWNFLLGPIHTANLAQPALTQILSLAYPVGDFLLFWAALMLLYTQSRSQRSGAALLVVGATIMLVTDCIFSYESLIGTYVSGHILDFGWVVAFLTLGLAGVLQGESVRSIPNQNQDGRSNLPVKLPAWISYLPYTWLAGAYGLLILSHATPFPIDFYGLGLGTGVVIALVVVRQIVEKIENNALNEQLSKALQHVQQQADQQMETNQVLKIEINERKKAEEQLTHDALHDALTGLPNRVLFMDRLGQAIEYSKRHNHPFSVLFLDLDHFKVINDSMGHSAGDHLLKSLAQRLRLALRSSDTVARLGGDEFVILLEGTNDLDSVISSANRIQDDLKIPFNLDAHKVFITASIGVVFSADEYNRPEEVLRDADLAMYRAKACGKACVEFFHANLRTEAISRLEVENELRQALERQEFMLNYQPILGLESSDLIGFEALIRWNHPSRGLLLPAEFISVAEETGLILPIGEWVLREACSRTKAWQETSANLSNLAINVNVSSKQIAQPNFLDQILRILEETRLNPACLRLEITESVLIDNQVKANQIFEKFSALGIQLEVDDFGTGYSALNYIQHFPIRTIKIDKSFVQEIGVTDKNSGLVQTIVMMAHEMGMDAIAEGVETNDQLQSLKQMGCNYGQGFLISRPMSGEKVIQWLNANQVQNPDNAASPAAGRAALSVT
ncbi:MAG: EAL domain-containing protein [Anaerolineaceae bacterium]|nr:EAL domain-containing protein [Anaerolineaceae bacterium]